MGAIVRIKSLKQDFTDSEGKIGQYIIDNPDNVYKLTALELGNITETSGASVIRFSKKLGYSGFQELKISLSKDEAKDNRRNERIYEVISILELAKEMRCETILITRYGRKDGYGKVYNGICNTLL